MNTFFSGTDMDELYNNSKLYNYYLSLIVNFDGKYCAKLSFPGKQKYSATTTLIDDNGKPYEVINDGENDILFIGDLDVEYNKITPPIEEWLKLKINELKEAKKKPIVAPAYQQKGNNAHQPTLFSDFNSLQKRVNDFKEGSKIARTPTARDLLAELIVSDPNAPMLSDKTILIAQELRLCCENKSYGEMALAFIYDNFSDIYEGLYEGEMADDNLYKSRLEGLLKELSIYEKQYTGNAFYEGFKEAINLSIEDINHEIQINK